MAERADDTMKVGLLMETAEAHQALATGALERLREHTAGIDAIVREEIRHTLLEELHTVVEDSRLASDALRQVGRSARLRFGLFGVVTLIIAVAVPAALFAWWLPGQAEIKALETRRADLTQNVTRLTGEGGRVQLRRCGTQQRLCVRIDRSAPAFGPGGEYRVVEGY
jgi:hypothetical protein